MAGQPGTGRRIVGIHQSGRIASAALVVDGGVIAAATEERFSRRKHDKSFPHQAIAYCLGEGDLAMDEVDAFAIGWNAGQNASLKYRGGFSDWMRYPGEWLAGVPNHLLPAIGGNVVGTTSLFHREDGGEVRIDYVDHHLSHARLGLEMSGFDECAILIVDGWSEQKVTTWYTAKDGEITRIRSRDFPHSIGCLYASLTEFLGYTPDLDEWKVMGMAAYGDPAKHRRAMERLVHLLPGGDYELDLSSFDFMNFDRPGWFGEKFVSLCGPPRRRGEPLEQRHYDLAAAGQEVFSRLMVHILDALREETGQDRLVYSGGVAMNSLFNGSIVDRTGFRRCSIGFAPDDSGNAIGAALEVARTMGDTPSAVDLSSHLGPTWSDEEIAKTLERFGLRSEAAGDPVEAAVDLLADGRIVGWFRGRMEFGQRALGSRSILASPGTAEMKDRINAAVKFREPFRPFAPMVRAERVPDLFDTTDPDPVRYMEKVYPFREEMKAKVPAVVHEDGTGRLQTVTADENPVLHRLLVAFEEKTGIPALVNTSFNLNGEPVVCSPSDALRTFVTSGMDALIIGDRVLRKSALL